MATFIYLDIDQGADYSVDITIDDPNDVPMNLDGFDLYAQFSKNYDSCSRYDFITSILDASLGKIRLQIAAGVTQYIKAGRYVFDVLAVNGDGRMRLAEGIVTVTPGVTRVSGYSGC